MYYAPIHFKPEEVFPRAVVEAHRGTGGTVRNKIWRLLDGRVLWTLDRIREKHGTTIVNDYLWGGINQFRGYRPIEALLDMDWACDTGRLRAKWSSFTSQHCFGRAIDCKFRHVTAEYVRQDIKNSPQDPAYQYITAIEEEVSWLHFDVRNWDRSSSGILFFNP